jgi:hypothetical protein
MNNEWIYPAPHSDTVTILCDETGPVDTVLQGEGTLRINPGCKGFSTSALLQASFTVMTNVFLKGDLLKQIPLQYDCCVELNLKFNIIHLSVDVKFKHTVPHFDDLQCANIKVSRLRWSRCRVLAFGTQVRVFKPGRSRRIFRAKKSSARLPSEGK